MLSQMQDIYIIPQGQGNVGEDWQEECKRWKECVCGVSEGYYGMLTLQNDMATASPKLRTAVSLEAISAHD